MKTILLFLVSLCVVQNMKAQCDNNLPVSEDFSNSSVIATCWNIVDNDGDTYSWVVEDLSGNNGLVSNSWTPATGPLTPDNWAITNMIDLTGYGAGSTIEVDWQVRTPDWSFDKERYTLYAATGNQLGDFTSSSVSFYEDLDNSDGSGLTYANRTLNLSSLAGQNIYLAFRHHNSTDQNEINIDNILVTGTSSGLSTDDFSKNNFKHFYNAASDVLSFRSNASIDKVEIYNLIGKRIINKSLSTVNVDLKLSDIADGVYIAKIEINNSFKSIKFIKK